MENQVENQEVQIENKEPQTENQVENTEIDESKLEYSKQVKKRIDKLSSKLSEKDNEINYLKSQLQSQSKPVENIQVNNTVRNDDTPKLGDFDSIEEYTQALTDYRVQQKLAEIEVTKAQRSKFNAYNDKVDEFVKSAPDFKVAVSEIEGIIQRDPQMVDLIVESDCGPQLAYHLANNEELLNKLMNMSAGRRLAALGKLEIELENRGKLTNNTSTLQPISRVTSKSGSSIKSTEPPQDYKKWVEWRKANKK